MTKTIWASLAFISGFAAVAHAQTVPPYQRNNYQYLTGTLTPSQLTSIYTVNAINAENPPKYFTLAVTTTATGFLIRLEGSLDNSNWYDLAVTNNAIGAQTNTVPRPSLYFRMRADSIAANTTVTGTAIGVW